MSPSSPSSVVSPAWAAWLALCVAALPSLADAQVFPGTPRAFRFGPEGALPSTITRVAPGEYSGDRRGDVAVVADGALHLVLGAYGFGRAVTLPTPGAGVVLDCVRWPQGAETADHDLVLCSVDGGHAPGLYSVAIDAGGQPVAKLQLAGGMAGTRELRLVAHDGVTRLFGLSTQSDSIASAIVLPDRVVDAPAIPLGGPAKALRVAGWESEAAPCCFVARGERIEVLALDGSPLETILATAPIHDFDAAWSRALGHGRVAIVSADPASAASWFELRDPAGVLAQLQGLGVAKPRLCFDDVFTRGELDVCAVNSHAPSGFAVFGGLGPTPDTYAFTLSGGVVFEFQSPGFGMNASHGNVAVHDIDGDGDRDAVFADQGTGTVWLQPSWAIDEIASAPAAVQPIPVYTHQNPAWQWFQFAFAAPPAFAATHVEITVYQRLESGGVTQYQLVASSVEAFLAAPFDPALQVTGVVPVFGQYQGPAATEADYVAALRMLASTPEGGAWTACGPEAFVEFHHARTPDPGNPGMFTDGTAGGTNPLPTVIGSGITGVGTTPPPPPPPGGG